MKKKKNQSFDCYCLKKKKLAMDRNYDRNGTGNKQIKRVKE
jgi:hypothetical protein